MDSVRKARRGAAAALAIASAALTAGCATGTPASGPVSAHLATAHQVAVTSSQAAASAAAVPPVFAASFAPAEAGRGGGRLALLSSRTGARLATGQRNTIVLATRPDPRSGNWPPEASGLTWAGDDAHLAVQFQLTAAISSVLAFGAFTAATISDGRTGPPPCPAATHDQCAESDPGYLAGGALSYVIQRRSGSGAVRTSLVTWRPGDSASTLLSFPGGPPPQSYGMTARGQAIWASGPSQPKGPWTVWRWSGGAPVKITTLPARGASPYYGVAAIAW